MSYVCVNGIQMIMWQHIGQSNTSTSKHHLDMTSNVKAMLLNPNNKKQIQNNPGHIVIVGNYVKIVYNIYKSSLKLQMRNYLDFTLKKKFSSCFAIIM